MIHEQLQQEHLNIFFTLPGETEMKKHFSTLFSQTKAGKSNIEHEENSDLDNYDEEVVNISVFSMMCSNKTAKIKMTNIFLVEKSELHISV